MARTIHVQPGDLNSASSAMGEQSHVTQQSIQHMTSTMHNLYNKGWIGEAANAFEKDMEEMLKVFTNLKSALEYCSDKLKGDIFNIWQNADQDAGNAFKTRG